MSAWSRLLDGDHGWGSFDIQTDRAGSMRYQLVLYPPGLDPQRRRALRLWRGCPLWGLSLFLTLALVLTNTMPAWPAVGCAAVVSIGAAASAFRAAARTRTQVRTVVAVTLVGICDPVARQRRNQIQTYAGILADADDRLQAGRIDACTHEAIWWQVYDQLTAVTPARASATRNTPRDG
jgi:uncharacterized protein DUF6611